MPGNSMTERADLHTTVRSLKGRRAIITGGTTGIGRAIAVLLAAEGAKVFICGREERYLKDALAHIREVGEGDGMVTELADPDKVRAFFDAGEAAMGGFDITVVNAAVAAGGLMQMTEEELRYAIAVDFTAYLLSAHHAAHRMTPISDLVIIGSMSAHVLGPSSTVYAGIKSGIAGFSEALRRELGPKGVKVSLVEPGKVGSNMQYPDVPDDKQRQMIEAEQMLRAEDIAVGVQFLLTQPTRSVIQQLVIVPRALEGE
jgi:NAD(P)-dependent dehydrogenase (short-subunit alcohol dehydrogenase family)